MELSKKEKKIRNFIETLQIKHGLEVDFKVNYANDQPGACFIPSKKTIIINKKYLKCLSLQELYFVAAHEYKHALFSAKQEGNSFKEFIQILPIIIALILCLLVHKNVLLLIINIFLLYVATMLSITFLWGTSPQTEELMCDHFANEEVGGGESLFHKINFLHQKKEKSYWKIFTLGLIKPTHPDIQDRIIESKKYPLKNLRINKPFTNQLYERM